MVWGSTFSRPPLSSYPARRGRQCQADCRASRKGARKKRRGIAKPSRKGARDRAGQGQTDIEKGDIGPNRETAILRRNPAHDLHTQGGKDKRIARAPQETADE